MSRQSSKLFIAATEALYTAGDHISELRTHAHALVNACLKKSRSPEIKALARKLRAVDNDRRWPVGCESLKDTRI